ncbi:FmdB family zinc ribbon protein [Nocardioides sp.]|uniref:FmdB family zinc ribbon protein n=1 Tax=Nocardioides sp. TaxID=35761 RepID=UPI002ED44DE7
MPTYQYACTECDHAFEQFQSFTDDALTECPQCHGRLRKLFNAVGVVFKGSGFYRNDSRAPEKSGASGSEKSGSEKSASEKSGSNGSPEKKKSDTSTTSTTSTPSTPAAAAS